MKTIDYIEDKVPTYALSYLVNGDASGMETSDIEACDAWFDSHTEKLKKQYPGASIQFLYDDNDECAFTHNPAFGLACATVTCVHAVWVNNDDPRESIALPWED